MSVLSPNRQARSPEETSRRLCLALLQEATEAMDRLQAGVDPEALHDFRVALRRLRSTIRAYRPYLESSIRKSLRRRLKQLASSTNPARDHEVMRARLAFEREAAPEAVRHGIDYVVNHLASPTQQDIASLSQEFFKLRESMTSRLRRFDFLVSDDAELDFRAVTSERIVDGTKVLMGIILPVKTIEEATALHEARIAAKRLRYLLEPWRSESKSAKRLVRRMKRLQDILGDLQDTHVLLLSVANCLETAALEQARRAQELALSDLDVDGSDAGLGDEPDSSKALLALIHHVKLERVRQFDAFLKWRERTAARLGKELHEFARELLPVEIHPLRRWILRTVPDSVVLGASQAVEEGFLPGSEIVERVRSVKQGRHVRYERIIERADDPASIQTLALSRKEFLSFWPMTEGRRISWRLYPLDEPSNWTLRRWISPSGETLTFAETREAKPSLEWMQDSRVEEVTDVPRYHPIALSRRKRPQTGGRRAKAPRGS